MPSDLKSLSMGELFSKLHNAIANFVETLDETIEENRQVGADEIRALRGHISERLQRNEEIDDNKKLLKVLDLFASNSAIMELVREDADDWLDFIETIEKRIREKGTEQGLAKEELEDIEKMKALTKQIKAMIRK